MASPRFLTLEESLQKFNLTKEVVNHACNHDDLVKIALIIGDWRTVGGLLGYSQENLGDIDEQYSTSTPKVKKIALLETWMNREGKNATYLKLLKVFHGLQRQDIIDSICNIIIVNNQEDSSECNKKTSSLAKMSFECCKYH